MVCTALAWLPPRRVHSTHFRLWLLHANHALF
jgi:hypothetical protein